MKSKKPVKTLDEIVLSYKVTFPVSVEGSVNTRSFKFQAGVEAELDYQVFEALKHSAYGKYLN